MAVALVVAAGSGERLGAGRPKAFVVLAGRPMLDWSLRTLARVPEIERIVVAAPPGVRPQPVRARSRGGAQADHQAASADVTWVDGGATRSESVRNALAVAGAAGAVVVHDAARPLAPAGLFSACLAALDDADAAIAAVPVTDTVKRAGPDMLVGATLDRSELWSVQTPQAFRRDALAAALDRPAAELARATDDAMLVEAAGGRVRIVPSTAENLKVTRPLDLRVAELLLC